MSYPQNPSEPSGQPEGGGSYGAPQQGSYGQQGAGQPPSYGSQPPAYGGGQPPSYGGGSGQPPYAPQGGVPSDKGFFAKLFDFSFSSYVLPSIVKVVYVLILIAIVIGWLFMTIAGFTESAGTGLALLILGAVVAFLYVILARITLEFYIAVIRIAEDVSDLKKQRQGVR